MKNYYFLLGLSIALLIPGVNWAAPATYSVTVTSGTDATGCSLSEAIQAINLQDDSFGGCVLSGGSDDSSIISIPANITTTIINSFDGENAFEIIRVDEDVVIRGIGGKAVIERSPSTQNFFRFLRTDGVNLRLENLVFKNGALRRPSSNFTSSGGAIFVEEGNLTINNVDFIDNKAIGVGESPAEAGALNVFKGALSIESSRFIRNKVISDNPDDEEGLIYSGGAIKATLNGASMIQDTLFEDNSAQASELFDLGCSGGAMQLFAIADGSQPANRIQMSITRSSFIANRCYDLQNGSTVTSLGGALSLGNNLNIAIADSTFADNSASLGGAIYFNGSQTDLALLNNTVSGNLSSDAAIYLTSGLGTGGSTSEIVIANSILSGNELDGRGSGYRDIRLLVADANTLLVKNNILADDRYGGGESYNFRRVPSNTFLNPTAAENLVLSAGSIQATPINNIIKSLRRSGAVLPYFPLPPNSPAIDNAVEFSSTDTQSSIIGPRTRYRPGCRGTQTISLPNFLPAPSFRRDQLGEARPNGTACDIGAIEYKDDELCLPILTKQGSLVLVCL